MPDIYLYISQPKVAQLADQAPALFSGITAKLDFKLPFVSGGLSGQNTSSTIGDLRRLIPKLQAQYDIPSFANMALSQTAPVFMSFDGQAARHIEDGHFWLALESASVALLLAGSASNAMGVGNVKAEISPSADPVGSFLRACAKEEGEEHDLSFNLSYVWQEMMDASIRSRVTLPRVEGMAVFSAMLRTSKVMERIGRGHIEVLVIGTPLYVKQVEARRQDAV